MKIPNLRVAYVKREGIFKCFYLGKNRLGVLCLWRITDQARLLQKGWSGIHELCESFRSKFKAM